MNNESLCNMSVMDMLNNPVSTTRLLTEMQSLLRNYGYADLAEVTEDALCEQWDLLQMSTAILSNAQLSRLEWIVVQAWWIHDMPWAKIASQYGIERKQIDNALQRAKRKLRKTHMEMAAC